MNYQLIYNQLINKAKSENRKKKQGTYCENHHIIPKCLGGSNKKENSVLLTGKEHFICHKLLVEIHSEENKLKFALWGMTIIKGTKRSYRIGAREYNLIKECISTSMIGNKLSTETKNKLSKVNKGKVLTKETKRKISITVKGLVRTQEHCKNISKSKKGEKHPAFGKRHSEKHKKKLSIANRGKKRSEETKIKISEQKKGEKNPNYGKNISKWQKQRISEANKGRQKITICPHCDKKGGVNLMTRYHFENCKLKITVGDRVNLNLNNPCHIGKIITEGKIKYKVTGKYEKRKSRW